MEFLIPICIFLGLYGIKRYKDKQEYKKVLDSLPFVIFIMDKNLKVIYKNEIAKTCIPSKFESLAVFNLLESELGFQYIENLALDKKREKTLKCYYFWQETKLYCLGILNINNNTNSDNSIKETMSLINNYANVNENLQIDLNTALTYVGKLVNSSWVCFFKKIGDEFVEEAEYVKDSPKKIKICDELKFFQYKKDLYRYRIISLDSIQEQSIREAWEKNNVTHKLIAPIWYNHKVYGILSIALKEKDFYNLESGIIQLVLAIVNFVIGIQISIKQNIQHKENLQNLQKALIIYLKNKTNHANEMYKKELESVEFLKRTEMVN